MLGILGGEGKQENKNEVQEMENYGARGRICGEAPWRNF